MMSYDSSRTLLENEDVMEQYDSVMGGGAAYGSMRPQSSSLYDPNKISNINGYVRKLHRNVQRVEGVFKELEGKTYNDQDAITAVKNAYKEKYGVDLPSSVTNSGSTTQPTDGSSSNSTANTGGYTAVSGSEEQPYKYGTMGDGIGKVQQNVGLVQDNKWGPKTHAKISELAPQYVNGFTDNDTLKVIQAIRAKTTRPATKIQSNPIAANVAQPAAPSRLAQPVQPTVNARNTYATNMAPGFKGV
jgi:hypothetical protein